MRIDVSSPAGSHSVIVEGDRVVLGAFEDCDVHLPEPTLAGYQFMVSRIAGVAGVTIVDLTGESGARVDGEPLAGSTMLHEGSQLLVGSCVVRITELGSLQNASSRSADQTQQQSYSVRSTGVAHASNHPDEGSVSVPAEVVASTVEIAQQAGSGGFGATDRRDDDRASAATATNMADSGPASLDATDSTSTSSDFGDFSSPMEAFGKPLHTQPVPTASGAARSSSESESSTRSTPLPTVSTRGSSQTGWRGVARNVGYRSEMFGRRIVQVLNFRLDVYGQTGTLERSVIVEMRGSSITGQLSNDEEVDVAGRWRDGVLDARTIVNRSNGATLKARKLRRYTVMYAIFAVLLVGTPASFLVRWVYDKVDPGGQQQINDITDQCKKDALAGKDEVAPSLIGMNYDNIGRVLIQHCVFASPTFRASDRPQDEVLSQNPKPGDHMTAGDVIAVEISTGRRPGP